MRRFSRVVVGGGFVLGTLVVLTQGCQEPTQVTLALSLDKKARCSEIAQGTAITVGVEPYDTEVRVSSGYVTARTQACNNATGEIGTLVVTPTDAGHAAIIVVVGYKGRDPTNCHPPAYAGCIVARRRFAFAEHTRLAMPITIDPDCADVPCDAFSTCSKGKCYDSATECSGSSCEKPGELPDGAVDEASVVEPDASGFDGGPDSGGKDGSAIDGGLDGNTLDATPQPTTCNGSVVSCGGETCEGANPVCCLGICQPTCAPTDRVCCTDGANPECETGFRCNRPLGAAYGTCGSDTKSGYPLCVNNVLYCNSGTQPCSGSANMCCSALSPPDCIPGGGCSMPDKKYCCVDADCIGIGAQTCMNGVVPLPGPPLPKPDQIPLKGLGTCQ